MRGPDAGLLRRYEVPIIREKWKGLLREVWFSNEGQREGRYERGGSTGRNVLAARTVVPSCTVACVELAAVVDRLFSEKVIPPGAYHLTSVIRLRANRSS